MTGTNNDSTGDQFEYELASKSKRVANYLIDIIAGTLLFVLITRFWIEYMDLPAEILGQTDTLRMRLIMTLFLTLYYILLEGALEGKSLGKYFTKTRVVNMDGDPPQFSTIVKRSILRLVPFEAFSFLGNRNDGWHDRWSDTIVIDEELSGWTNNTI